MYSYSFVFFSIKRAGTHIFMDRWDTKSLREDHRHRHRRENPSFSSTLLDAIYNSIDDQGHNKEEELIFYKESTMRKKHNTMPNITTNNIGLKKHQHHQQQQEEEMASFRRACMIEKWMEKKKKNNNNKVNEQKVVASRNDRVFMLQNSSSSSSDSSCGGGFSSSESDSVYASKSSSSCYNTMQRPIKPIRTSLSEKPAQLDKLNYSCSTQKPKHENGFVKTKSRALKIYGDLKKVKQPISPGGKLATFLNSLFTNASKKAKTAGGFDERSKSKSTTTSTCSSASSFSRSCLSKTPSSSRGKFSNNNGSGGNVKRSVRFCPVSVIVDEDCRPCGHKSLHEDHQPAGLMAVSTTTLRDAEIKCYVMGGNYRVEEVAKDLLKNYQKEKGADLDMRDCVQDDNIGDSDVDDDDDASCSSSDLFELDNLSAIGIERYREELPVYETTHFNTNRAIANGLIM